MSEFYKWLSISPLLADADARPGEADHGDGGAEPPLPGRGPPPLPLLHVRLLRHLAADGGAAIRARLRAGECVIRFVILAGHIYSHFY